MAMLVYQSVIFFNWVKTTNLPSLKITAKAPGNGWLEDEAFPFGAKGLFSGAFAVSFGEGICIPFTPTEDFCSHKNPSLNFLPRFVWSYFFLNIWPNKKWVRKIFSAQLLPIASIPPPNTTKAARNLWGARALPPSSCIASEHHPDDSQRVRWFNAGVEPLWGPWSPLVCWNTGDRWVLDG